MCLVKEINADPMGTLYLIIMEFKFGDMTEGRSNRRLCLWPLGHHACGGGIGINILDW
jgi:hypothetical protein